MPCDSNCLCNNAGNKEPALWKDLPNKKLLIIKYILMIDKAVTSTMSAPSFWFPCSLLASVHVFKVILIHATLKKW